MMLFGRAAERRHLDGLLVGARRGASSALLVRGDPGIGKTALLEATADSASDFTLLRVRALDAEDEIPFAGLFDLVRPVLGAIEHIPEPQQRALQGALAIGPPAPGDRFAVAAATLGLLAAAALDAPLLAMVDDAHSLDH